MAARSDSLTHGSSSRSTLARAVSFWNCFSVPLSVSVSVNSTSNNSHGILLENKDMKSLLRGWLETSEVSRKLLRQVHCPAVTLRSGKSGCLIPWTHGGSSQKRDSICLVYLKGPLKMTRLHLLLLVPILVLCDDNVKVGQNILSPSTFKECCFRPSSLSRSFDLWTAWASGKGCHRSKRSYFLD